MATGGTPLTRVFLVLALLAFPATLITLEQPVLAQDGDAASKLKEGLELLRSGDPEKTEQAIKILRQALAATPDSTEVLAALQKAEWRALINLVSNPKGAKVAAALFDIAQPNLPERAFNMDEMKKLVTTAVTDLDDYGARFDAAISLSRVYGEFAVPELVKYLTSSNTEYKINAHVTLMNRIGRDAVLPLDEAAHHSKNSQVRMLAAAELGVIGDERSLATLAEMMSTEDPNVREKATEAFNRIAQRHTWAVGMSPSDLYLRLARLYYSGDYRVMAFTDRPMVLWNWDGELKYTPVPRHLYMLKLAEEAAYDALRTDASNSAARSLLARIFSSEKAASDAVASVSEDELTKSYADGLASVPGIVASMGWATLDEALAGCIEEDDQAAAAFILGVMPETYGGTEFMSDSPVVMATTNSAGAVRIAAAEAVLRFNGSQRLSAFPDPDGFINLVATAAGEIVPRYVLVIDSNDERRNKVMTDLGEAKYVAFDARTGSDGVVRALRLAGLDLIVISTDLSDMDPLGLIRQLGEDDRTKNVPIVVIGTEEQNSDEAWRNLYADKVKALAPVPSGPGLPTDAFRSAVAGAFSGDDPDAAARYARSAQVLAALAHTDTGNALFNWAALTETLTALLTADVPNDPPVRMNAIHAMANLGDGAALAPLIEFFGKTDDNGLKAAAGNAIAALCRANAAEMDEDSFKILLAGTAADDEGVRNAAFGALGAAQLTDEQIAKAAMQNRPKAVGGGEGS